MRQKSRKVAAARVIAGVQCRFCGAMKGEMCWNEHGRQTASFVHRSRTATFKRKRFTPSPVQPRQAQPDWTDAYWAQAGSVR